MKLQRVGRFPIQSSRAVVDTLSRQCRDNREIRDCRHAILLCRHKTRKSEAKKDVEMVYFALCFTALIQSRFKLYTLTDHVR